MNDILPCMRCGLFFKGDSVKSFDSENAPDGGYCDGCRASWETAVRLVKEGESIRAVRSVFQVPERLPSTGKVDHLWHELASRTHSAFLVAFFKSPDSLGQGDLKMLYKGSKDGVEAYVSALERCVASLRKRFGLLR